MSTVLSSIYLYYKYRSTHIDMVLQDKLHFLLHLSKAILNAKGSVGVGFDEGVNLSTQDTPSPSIYMVNFLSFFIFSNEKY